MIVDLACRLGDYAVKGNGVLSDLIVVSNPKVIAIGVDEVGVGALFGPAVIVACADTTGWRDEDVADSKSVKSEKRRGRIAAKIATNMRWSIISVASEVIDTYGFKTALDNACAVVIRDITQRLAGPGIQFEVTLDGSDRKLADWLSGQTGAPVRCLIKADATEFEVSAASLVAKDARDRWCRQTVLNYPTLSLYDIAANKGYSTPKHEAALLQYGTTQWHRVVATQTRMKHLNEKRIHDQNTIAAATV